MKNLFMPWAVALLMASPLVSPAQEQEIEVNEMDEYRFAPIAPDYVEDATKVGDWGAHWFVGLSGGGSVFAGNPLGCGDMFDRTRPLVRIEAGKWFTPAIGGRIAAEGMWFADANLHNAKYQSYRADFLYDVIGLRRFNTGVGDWSIIPYLGIGFAYNSSAGIGTVVGGYGIQAKMELGSDLALSMELGGQIMPSRFDGFKGKSRWADNLFGLSVGLSYSFGGNHWEHLYDARPYIDQYDRIMAYCSDLRKDNGRLRSMHNADLRVAAEFKKILAVEGLLSKYWPRLSAIANGESDFFGGNYGGESLDGKRRPVNDYSGLNSLMARIGASEQGLAEYPEIEDYAEAVISFNDSAYNPATLAAMLQNLKAILGEDDFEAYLENIKNGAAPNSIIEMVGVDKWKELLAEMSAKEVCIGAPIYFFFKIRTSTLTDPSQLVNLDAAARIAKTYGLAIRVCGAADSATGSASINERLSHDRAEYIRQQLIERGIPESSIQMTARGGVNEFASNEANRNTRIELYRL